MKTKVKHIKDRNVTAILDSSDPIMKIRLS